jgi:type I restriction enzyme S subunit
MNAELLLAHFNRISDAPDAVQRLRTFIFDLAVRGKLAEQDPNEEPAIETLKKTQALKGQKTKKESLAIEFDEYPFTLPSGWEFVRIGMISELENGDRSKNYPSRDEFVASGIPFINAGHLQSGRVCLTAMNYIPENRFNLLKSGKVRSGDILFCLRGSLGKSALVTDISRGAVASSLVIIRLMAQINPHFVLDYLFSSLAIRMIDRYDNGTAQPNLSSADLGKFIFPLPPIGEQHRIVAKVDELMALCDRLEAAQHQLATRRDHLAAASHYHLNNGADAAALRRHTNFFVGHLPSLTARPDQIKALRQTILNLAVRGHLVPQDSNDEPASDLLRRIGTEKAQLAKEGTLKKDKALWEGLPNEPPYQLPANWSWTHLQDVFEISRGGSPRPAGDPRYFGGPIPWITVGEITKDGQKYLTETESGLTDEGAERSRFINPGDLLLTNSGATLGVPKISRIKACMNDGVAVLRLFHTAPLNDFAYLYLHSQTDAFRKVNQGMGQPNLNTPIIAGWFFPVPPLAEQRRIVTKVDELMALCDQLESQLTTAQTETSRLLEAVLFNALNDTQPPIHTQLAIQA